MLHLVQNLRTPLRRSVHSSRSISSISTIGAALDHAVQTLPHREALRAFSNAGRDSDLRWSYVEFQQYVNELANGFVELQLKKGDVLALWLPNNAEHIVAQYAAAKAGITIASIDSSISTPEELAFVLQDSQSSALLFEPKVNQVNQGNVVQQLLANEKDNKSSKLHSVITTAIDPQPGLFQFRHILVDSPEIHVMKQRQAGINADTPAITSYHGKKSYLLILSYFVFCILYFVFCILYFVFCLYLHRD